MSDTFIPYGRHVIDDTDIAAVVEVMRSDWLTTGPVVGNFERAFAAFVGAQHAVAVSNGTAALHLMMLAAGIGPEDEVIVPALTFAASANCARYAGATVKFADVRPDTLTIDVDHVASLIGERTRAIVAVDYGGLPADLDELRELATRHGLILVEDACHAPGARYKDRAVGAIADMTAFSLHPVKHMTTGEGGVVTTNDDSLAARVRLLRSHGIATDHRQRELAGTWRYDMVELGFNYRLTDIQSALGLTQLAKMPKALARRREIAMRYAAELGGNPRISLPVEPADRVHAWHLYPIRLVAENAATLRQQVFAALRARGVGVNVHYIPVYMHSYYRSLGYSPGLCPRTERAYDALLSLPMWHGLRDDDQSKVIANLVAAIDQYV
ncbi:MAG: UDP-4-amino-4,6-dideoxy-N-acetyl-beta-L-altrosamine transaminase [Steroidobacter sp.]